VKAAVTGQGRAGKEQVAFMVRRVLNAPTLTGPPDATDALALAICQLWRGAAAAKVQRAIAGATR
jgi:crossover junction endodeoxyribonuclease RuvC